MSYPGRAPILVFTLAILLVGMASTIWLAYENQPAPILSSTPTPTLTPTETVTETPSTPPTATATSSAAPKAKASQALPDYALVISKIGITVPIIKDVDSVNEEVYLKALEGGVAQYRGTPLPGGLGNSFIFGHSSYYADKPGRYKQIFRKLNELAVGDEMIVREKSTDLRFRVTRSVIIEPTDFSVLAQPGDKKQLTLMTCWPPGTTDKRYIIQAELIE